MSDGERELIYRLQDRVDDLRAERDRLAATITRIRELADNYRDRDQMYLLSFLAKELDAALNDTDPPVAYAALDDNQDTP